jgi:hypothetical protein
MASFHGTMSRGESWAVDPAVPWFSFFIHWQIKVEWLPISVEDEMEPQLFLSDLQLLQSHTISQPGSDGQRASHFRAGEQQAGSEDPPDRGEAILVR